MILNLALKYIFNSMWYIDIDKVSDKAICCVAYLSNYWVDWNYLLINFSDLFNLLNSLNLLNFLIIS
jgi:hypothetical protein